MKLIALASLVLLAPSAVVRFERDGVRVGDALVRGSVVELKNERGAALLASGSSVEALTSSLEIEITAERTLTLEPGLRVTRVEGGYRFASHRDRAIRFAASGVTVAAASPVLVAVAAEGWLVGDRALSGAALQAGVQNQDDAESNIEKMLREKDRMRAGGVPKLSTRKHRLFWGSPFTMGQAANSISLRQMGRVSPDGAP